jgi:hypothetical protein
VHKNPERVQHQAIELAQCHTCGIAGFRVSALPPVSPAVIHVKRLQRFEENPKSQNKLFLPKNSIMIASELQNTLIREILAIQNTTVLRKLDSYLKKIKQEDRADLSDYERRVIEIGLSQVNEGKYITDEEVSRKTKLWLDE